MNKRRIKDRYYPQILFLWIIISIFCGCSDPQSSPETQFRSNNKLDPGLFTDNSIPVNGVDRNYDFYVPSDIETSKLPLVVLLHGSGASPSDLTGQSRDTSPNKVWMNIADNEKIILVYPEGSTNDPVEHLVWNDCRADAINSSSLDDIGFMSVLIDHFSQMSNVDTSRIYVSGSSNGGQMALRVAMEMPDMVVAIAAILAAMPAVSSCLPSNQISVLFMNGTDDPVVPFNGGEVSPNIGGRGTVLPTEESVNIWVDFNQADPVPITTDFPNINILDGSIVRKSAYMNMSEGTEVILYEVSGGGHAEPSIQELYSLLTRPLVGNQNQDIEMANEVWDFFKDKRL